MKLNTKKAQELGNLPDLIIGLVVIGIVIVVGFLIMAQAKTQIETIEGINSSGQNSSGGYPSYGWNATGETVEAMSTIPGWLGIIVVTVIGGFLIALITNLFRQR